MTFTDTTGQDLVVSKVRMGVITNQPYANWKKDIQILPVPIPPEHQYFFGTLGAGPATTLQAGGSVSSVLGQIPVPKGLTQGFIIHTGGSSYGSPTLTIGLTKKAIATFPIIIPINGPAPNKRTTTGQP